MDGFLGYLTDNGEQFLKGLIILVVGWYAAKLLRAGIGKAMGRKKADPALISFISTLVYVVVLSFVFVSALGRFGIQTSAMVAVIGAAGLAIALSLQGSLANFAAGIIIIILRPFRAGDFVDVSGTSGFVEEVNLLASIIRTPDNKTVIVPNANITGGNIVNYSKKDTRRVDLVFGIGYGDDIQKAKNILEDILKSNERVLDDPAYKVALSELGDSSVNFVCRPWVKTEDYWDVYFGVTEEVKKRFDAEGVTIPFPQRDVHIYQEQSG
jgi:small conductance mechanosensitive channel